MSDTQDGPTAQSPTPRIADPDAYPVLTVLMLMLGGFVLPVVGWLAGVVMLWNGTAWSTAQKWLGTLVWPVIVAVPLVLFGIGRHTGGQPWPFVTGLVLGALGVLVVLPWTCVRLLRSARRRR
ncbi:hypothetical protein [Pseudonocardia sp. KRD291]|uniref:hypothetical protein n=1 Tax=Pseudonocardia sp. KRD291 TaxID=2792007 RepID=UPI001C4A0EF5|nr:hypothetical protein [Pseudonocardia sp. KRD291]MBW0102727.1 hypothetical protein [Pseudonocardia sp. KRD291]